MILISKNYPSNIHGTVQIINEKRLAYYLFSLHSVNGVATIAVFRVEETDTLTIKTIG